MSHLSVAVAAALTERSKIQDPVQRGTPDTIIQQLDDAKSDRLMAGSCAACSRVAGSFPDHSWRDDAHEARSEADICVLTS